MYRHEKKNKTSRDRQPGCDMPSEMFCHVIKIKLELFWNSKWWNSKVDSWLYCRFRRYQVYVWFFGLKNIQCRAFYILFIVFPGEQFINRFVNSTLGVTKCACIDQLILHTYYIFLYFYRRCSVSSCKHRGWWYLYIPSRSLIQDEISCRWLFYIWTEARREIQFRKCNSIQMTCVIYCHICL